jgi:hypothetical protein
MQWFGRNLEDYLQMFREKYPQFDFTYSTAARVLSAYEEYADLPCLSGEIPSVWGVAADEEATFFQRDRQIESQLLTAETLAAVAEHLHLSWRPATADQWQGTFYEAAFFARKDPIQPGAELDTLWQMHIFTQDHNGGGQEGALSTFQKRVIQQRCLGYTQALIDQTLDEIGQRLALDSAHCLLGLQPARAGLARRLVRDSCRRSSWTPNTRAWSITKARRWRCRFNNFDAEQVLVHLALLGDPVGGLPGIQGATGSYER